PTVVQPTVPTAEPVHETPPNTPLPTAQPEATAPADTTEPTPTEPESGPALDFSDLPKDGEPGAEKEPPRDPAQEANAHRTFVGFIWDGFVNLMVMIFGTEWFPQSAQERNAVIEAWVNALLWMGTRILNPLQLAYAATASYCFTRLFTFLRWWKNRREKRARVQPQEAQETEEPEQPGTNQQPHNFAGVNATED
ncbi:MAG TPA: hypothetical protein VK327_02250, partial [Candidatus Paceibacterota bacterium]|nr:hypothetical protein [Candidatus Paceibacterota bacterium]